MFEEGIGAFQQYGGKLQHQAEMKAGNEIGNIQPFKESATLRISGKLVQNDKS